MSTRPDRLRRNDGLPTNTPEYFAWRAMIKRCNSPAWHRWYGGRGITVCARWRESFAAFLADVGARPGAGYSLDRVDNDRGYEPDNVRWATRREQMRNTRANRRITVGGTTRTLAEWAERAGLRPHAVLDRVKRGWAIEEAVTTPKHARGDGRFE